MKGNRAVRFAVVGLALALAGCGGKSTAPTVEAPVPEKITLANVSRDDYEEMLKVLTFTPAQREAFMARLKQRNAAYEKWARESGYDRVQKDLADARAANNQAKVAQLEPQAAKLSAEQERTRWKLRRDFDTVLTLDQQRQWAGYQLCERAVEQAGGALTDKQRQQARQHCDAIAAQRVGPDTFKSDPYLLLDAAAEQEAARQVREKVLKQ